MEELRAERETYAERMVNSTATFHLRGVLPKIQEIAKKKARRLGSQNKWTDEVTDEWYYIELYREMLVKIVTHAGEVDDSRYSHDDMEDLLESLPASEVTKVINVCGALMTGIYLADQREDAGFPGGSADVDGEQPAAPADQDGTSLEG